MYNVVTIGSGVVLAVVGVVILAMALGGGSDTDTNTRQQAPVPISSSGDGGRSALRVLQDGSNSGDGTNRSSNAADV